MLKEILESSKKEYTGREIKKAIIDFNNGEVEDLYRFILDEFDYFKDFKYKFEKDGTISFKKGSLKGTIEFYPRYSTYISAYILPDEADIYKENGPKIDEVDLTEFWKKIEYEWDLNNNM